MEELLEKLDEILDEIVDNLDGNIADIWVKAEDFKREVRTHVENNAENTGSD